MMRPDGLHHPVPLAEYLSWPAYGSSALKAMRQGPPARVLWERANPRQNTDATILGAAADCAITEPDHYPARYIVKPEGMSFASKEGKAWRDDPVRAGKILLPFDTGAKVDAIRLAFMSKEPAAASIANALYRQASVIWTDPTTGIRLKSRPDWHTAEATYDLKVTRFAGPGFALAAFRMGWMHQVALARTGLRATGWTGSRGRIVAIHPEAPHFVWCVEVKPDWLDWLALDNEGTLSELAECERTGEWPDTRDDWTLIEPPPWALGDVAPAVALEEVEE